MAQVKGYFGIGIDGASKAGNVGNLIRTAHAFGAAFVFASQPRHDHTGEPITRDFADTARTSEKLPFYQVDSIQDLPMPVGCRVVAVELDDQAIDLPSFRHPPQALYVLGAEWHGVSRPVLDCADDIIKIPTRFSLNVATAGAIIMYDRIRLLGNFAERPLMAGQKPEEVDAHVHGGPRSRKAKRLPG